MRIGNRLPGRQQGFTYLLLLFALAIGGIGLAALGEQARLRHQRELETELAFRGHEYARAIASYVQASPAGSRALPSSLNDLLEDRRSGRIVRHLRRPYADPMTPPPLEGALAAPDGPYGWVLLGPAGQGCGSDAAGPNSAPTGVSAVRSGSSRPLWRRSAGPRQLACELVFRHQDHLVSMRPTAPSDPRPDPSP